LTKFVAERLLSPHKQRSPLGWDPYKKLKCSLFCTGFLSFPAPREVDRENGIELLQLDSENLPTITEANKILSFVGVLLENCIKIAILIKKKII
jgi:hypothetical protein